MRLRSIILALVVGFAPLIATPWVADAQPIQGIYVSGSAGLRAPFPTKNTSLAPGISGDFNINQLSTEEQELHRRANRVAKVSMQDIKMLRPEQVRLGRENKDICIRLKDDIEKAHREYDRRFKPIMDHPVDYFYRWMVEILADGDSTAIGEYPYATATKHR